MAEKGKILYSLGIDNSELERDAQKSVNTFRKIGDSAEDEGGRIDNTFKNLARGVAAFFTIQQATQLVQGLVKVRGEFQQLEIAFGTMLQSKEKADALMAEMVDLAAQTPFGLTDVASGAKQLLAYGFAAESITDNIKMLGNVASGVGSQVGDLIYLYGTLKASGRVTQMDINQFAGRGIPIYAELAKVLNTNVEAVRDFVGEGKVGFADIEKAFKNMTGDGGMFFNLMQAQSASLTGQISNLQDSIQTMFNEIGRSGEGLFSNAISGASYLVEHYKEIGKALKILIATYGVYRTALILTSVAQATKIAGSKAMIAAELSAALSGKAVTAGMILQAGAMNLATAAQARLNAMFAANPVGLVITAIAALATTMYYFHDSTTAAERAQKKLNDTLDDNRKKIDDVKTKTQELSYIINDNTQTKSAQIIAFRQLQELYGSRLKDLTLEEFRLKTNTEQQKRFNQELQNIGLEDLKERYKKATDAAKALSTITIQLGDGTTSTQDNTMSKKYQTALGHAEKIRAQIEDIELTEKLAAMTAEQLAQYYRDQLPPLKKQIDEWEKTYGKIERSSDGSIELQRTWNSFQINGAIRQWNTLLGLIKQSNQASGGGATSPTTPSQFKERAQKAKEDAANEADAIKRALLLKQAAKDEKTYRDMMGETDRSAVRSLGGTHDKLINERKRKSDGLKREREMYKEHLAEQKKDFDESARLSAFEGLDKDIEQIKIKYEKAIERAKELNVFTEELKNELALRQQTEIDFSKNQAAKDKAKKDAEDLKEWTKNAIEAYGSYDQKLNDIRDKFAKERAKTNDTDILIGINKAEKAAMKSLDEEQAAALVKSEKFFNDILLTSTSAVEAQIRNIETLINNAALGSSQRAQLERELADVQKLIPMTKDDRVISQANDELLRIDKTLALLKQKGLENTEVYRDLFKQRFGVEAEKGDANVNKLKTSLQLLADLAPAISQLGDSLKDLGGDGALGDIGAALSGIGSNLNDFVGAFEKAEANGVTSMNAILAAVQFVIQTISMITTAAAKRKAAEHEWYISRLEFQYKMNQSVLEEMKMRDKMGKSWFSTNNVRDMENAMGRMKTAFDLYQKSFDDLSKGRVKLGMRNAVDWGKATSSMINGASAGFIIGSAVPVIGNIIGAVVGGVIGLVAGIFGGKKKKDKWGSLLGEFPELVRTAADGTKVLNEYLAKTLISGSAINAETKAMLENVLHFKDEYQKSLAEISTIVKDVAGNLGDNLRNALVQAFKAGEDAAVSFGDNVSKVLEDLVAQMLFNEIFGKQLDALRDRMIASFDLMSGSYDANWVDDILDFYKNATGSANLFFQTLDEVNKRMSEQGLKMFVKDDSKKGKNSLQGAYAQASQESIDLLAGQTMAFKVAQVETNTHLKLIASIHSEHLEHARNTAQNTGATVIELKTAVAELKGINNKMNNNANNALAAGL